MAALRAGAVLGDLEVDITCPLLGEWPLFLATTDDIQAGQWLISNQRSLADRAASAWAYQNILPTKVVKLRPGDFLQLSRQAGEWSLVLTPRVSTLKSAFSVSTLAEAISIVDESIAQAARQIADSRQPVMLLLSGGVDSGLLCSLLANCGADVTALSMSTPWGNELEGARRTAEAANVPLITLELSEQEIFNAIDDTLMWLQHYDTEAVLIQLLVIIAHRYASARSMDLVTGMGSDLLNAATETGMALASGDSMEQRVLNASSSGIFQTNALRTFDGTRLHHPYWQLGTISAQLAVSEQLKHSGGYEKYYLRKLAARRLPYATAFGKKLAIQQGSNLQRGLNELAAPESLDNYLQSRWSSIEGLMRPAAGRA